MHIQPIVVGTAGHIDHGKSTLVKALTGIDPDRLKEEVERGMTIDIGFARFQLPDGRTVGVVDVPGHERFVKNMVAGATGIDVVILVVAADDGVMPQTREHLAIMTLLGLTRGLVALTKIDAVEPALVELAAEDVRAAVKGTFLENAPILPLSSLTGAGLDEFKAVLFRMAAEAKPKSSEGVFRLPIQRVFSSHGHGTVITGIPISGMAKVGDVLEILPAGITTKVRGLQAYGQSVDGIRAGHSSAINVADVDHRAVSRGMVAATPGFFRSSKMLGATVRALPDLDRPIEDRTQIRFHAGTAEVLGELVLLDHDVLEPGGEALAQLRLEEPVVIAPGDRFVLRLASPAYVLGGGVVLEESKHRLKRFKKFVIEELARASLSLASPRDLLETVLVRARPGLLGPEDLSVEIKRSATETERLLNDLGSQKKALRIGTPPRWIHAERLAAALVKVEASLQSWFEGEHSHREVMDVRELRRATGFAADFLQALLVELEKAGKAKVEAGGLVRRTSGKPALDPALEDLLARVRGALADAHYQPPTPPELVERLKVPAKSVQRALELLLDRGEIHAIQPGEIYFAHATYEAAKSAVVRNCEKNRSLDIPSLRDELQTTRKFLIPMLEHFDTAGITIRQGGTRVLRRR
ncbi:MAG: selenocysteine-specific translation elongation factor [Planctomycetota bacterium]|nr:selenocysteine-specific translation elongation factor [Planctomycetota bacterium]